MEKVFARVSLSSPLSVAVARTSQSLETLAAIIKTELVIYIYRHKVMTKDFSILINLFAQDKVELEITLSVFNAMTVEEKRSELAWLRTYIEQSHPTKETIGEAINKMPIKSTMTPIVILETCEFKTALWKICELPENELEKAVITLLTLFRHSDTKRRETFCKNGCNHEWHNIQKKNYYNSEVTIETKNWWEKIKNTLSRK